MPERTNSKAKLSRLETIVRENVPYFFVDGFWGLVTLDGVVRIHLYRLHYPLETGTLCKEIVATIAIPHSSLWKVLDELNDIHRETSGGGKTKRRAKKASSSAKG